LGVKFQLSSSKFELISLSSHVEFELMPSFGITHDGSRIVHPEVNRQVRAVDALAMLSLFGCKQHAISVWLGFHHWASYVFGFYRSFAEKPSRTLRGDGCEWYWDVLVGRPNSDTVTHNPISERRQAPKHQPSVALGE
jgi:hypothetical protein